jgi:hypothetical protein
MNPEAEDDKEYTKGCVKCVLWLLLFCAVSAGVGWLCKYGLDQTLLPDWFKYPFSIIIGLVTLGIIVWLVFRNLPPLEPDYDEPY